MKKRVTINQKHTIYSQSQKEESGSITQKKIIKTRKEKKQKIRNKEEIKINRKTKLKTVINIYISKITLIVTELNTQKTQSGILNKNNKSI